DGDGQVTLDLGTYDDYARAVAVQPDQKIIVAGVSLDALSVFQGAVIRLNADGTLDTSFGTGGLITLPIGGASAEVNDITVQADGKILVVGRGLHPGNDVAVLRFHPDGTLDTDWGGTGMVFTDAGGNDNAFAIEVGLDGSVFVSGGGGAIATIDVILIRYDEHGVPDPAFGEEGVVLTDLGGTPDVGYALVLRPDGRIIVGGMTNTPTGLDVLVLQYLPDGTLDGSFGTGGVVITPATSGPDVATSIGLQTDGRIVVGGLADSGGASDLLIVRYLPDGTLDNTFDLDGMVTTNIGPGYDELTGSVIQSDGKILGCGRTDTNGSIDFLLVRYNASVTTGLAEAGIAPLGMSLLPNPASESALLQIEPHSSAPATIVICDAQGRVVRTMTTDRGSGTRRIVLDLATLSAGTYGVRVAVDDEVASALLLKQ
ncbi:MAG TPA: T9SS type A sorting domain-containing protein, partial [Flavobacteriales bacterium]|nr:T9SS type A sorting domain-containing protein [Flavobacteriales bacterium]